MPPLKPRSAPPWMASLGEHDAQGLFDAPAPCAGFAPPPSPGPIQHGLERRIGPRALPGLFDRFRGPDAPAPSSARAHREALRALVLDDLRALFNTTSHEHLLDPLRLRAVLDSCWNYGLRSISGTFDGPKAWEDIEAAIRTAIERFEPRIVPGSVEITGLQESGVARHNVLSFQIRGLIRDLPQALPFAARSTIDLETRRVWLEARRGAPGHEPDPEQA